MEHLLISRQLVWLAGLDVGEYGVPKLCRWDIYRSAATRQHVAQSFRVKEEEQLVLYDRPSERSAPLIAVREWPWRVGVIVEPVIRVQVSAVPIPFRVSMEGIAAGLGGEVHVDPGSAAVLPGVAVVNDREFLNLICAEHIVARSRVVQVAVSIVHVPAVDGEQIRSTRHPVRSEVAVPRTGTEHDAGARQCIVRQVSAGIGSQLDLLGTVCTRQVRALCFQQRRCACYFHKLRSALQGHSHIRRYNLPDHGIHGLSNRGKSRCGYLQPVSSGA